MTSFTPNIALRIRAIVHGRRPSRNPYLTPLDIVNDSAICCAFSWVGRNNTIDNAKKAKWFNANRAKFGDRSRRRSAARDLAACFTPLDFMAYDRPRCRSKFAPENSLKRFALESTRTR